MPVGYPLTEKKGDTMDPSASAEHAWSFGKPAVTR